MPAVTRITRPRALAITKRMLLNERNHTVTDSTAPFPPGVGPAQRQNLQGPANGTYFVLWHCAVTRQALGTSTTCSAMTSAILAAIPPAFKA